MLPTKSAPTAGESIVLELSGLPPYKDTSRSIRNIGHSRYAVFKAIRKAAIAAMAGRAPYRGPVRLDFTIRANQLHNRRSLVDYLGGIMDTLDGSHGPTFTYLPIVYEDDCQVCGGRSRIIPADRPSYQITLTFLDPDGADEEFRALD